jgi:hypothetical protein
MPKPKPKKSKSSRVFPAVLLMVLAGALILQYFVLDYYLPANNDHPPAWAAHLSDQTYRLSIVGFWLGVVLVACYVTVALMSKRRKRR